MPIKKDGTGKRWVEMELLLPGTPDEVWHAMATGPGTTAWFVRTEIEPRVGGEVRFDFGVGPITPGEVTVWEPPSRFGYVEREWAEGAPPCATEITITARSGDVCVMRMVHSLYSTSDEWDDEVEGFERGWPVFFELLRTYLAHFAGAQAAMFMTTARSHAPSPDVWHRLVDTLGLANAAVGERRTVAAEPERLSGVVERVHQDREQRYVLVRLDAPSPGIALFGTSDKRTQNAGTGEKPATQVSVCRYFYGDDASAGAAQAEPSWQTWLVETFGAQ